MVAHSSIGGIEDLYYNPHTDLIWTAGEFPGHRYMVGMDMSYLQTWEPCGCSLSALPCLAEEELNDLIEDLEELGEDVSEWGAAMELVNYMQKIPVFLCAFFLLSCAKSSPSSVSQCGWSYSRCEVCDDGG